MLVVLLEEDVVVVTAVALLFFSPTLVMIVEMLLTYGNRIDRRDVREIVCAVLCFGHLGV